MSTSEDFEKWFSDSYGIDISIDRAGEGYIYDQINDKWIGYQACAAHYEAELLKRDALIAEKDKELAKIKEFSIDGVASNVATEALSLTHDSVKLKEVSTVNSVAKGDESWLVVSDTLQEPVGIDRGTKLYTIVKGEAE